MTPRQGNYGDQDWAFPRQYRPGLTPEPRICWRCVGVTILVVGVIITMFVLALTS